MYKLKEENPGFRTGRKICPNCLKPLSTCYCSLLQPFDPDINFVILIHPKEFKNACGTGRMAHICLKDSLLIKGVDFSKNKDVNALLADKRSCAVVLYPGKKSTNLNDVDGGRVRLQPGNKKLLVFVPDGTWKAAKKMMKLSRNLHSLPRICLSPTRKSSYSIRLQPDEMCLSTVESIFELINALERKKLIDIKPKGAQKNLMDVFNRMVNEQVSYKNNPDRKGYRKRGLRTQKVVRPAKRWLKRSLFYNH